MFPSDTQISEFRKHFPCLRRPSAKLVRASLRCWLRWGATLQKFFVTASASRLSCDRSVEALEESADQHAFDEVNREGSVPWEDIEKGLGLA